MTTPGLGDRISGLILDDETIRQPASAGVACLSGGRSGDLATARLAAMNSPALAPLPWRATGNRDARRGIVTPTAAHERQAEESA